MVTRIVGNVDGNEILFVLKDETKGLWETIVPLDLDGTYVIDLMAEDEAGNSSYFATVLFTVDTDKLHVAFTLLKYSLLKRERGYGLKSKEGIRLEQRLGGYLLKGNHFGYSLERGHHCAL